MRRIHPALLLPAFLLGTCLDAALPALLPGSPGLIPMARAAAGVVLAWVNGTEINADQLLLSAGRVSPESGALLSEAQKEELLRRLIEDEVLYQEAKRLGYAEDPKVKKVMANTLLREVVYDKVKNSDFTDEMLRDYFDAHREEFTVPAKVQIKLILIGTAERSAVEARRLALNLRRELLTAPDRFAELAAAHSEDAYKRRGGDAGFVAAEGKPGLSQALVDAAFALEVGNISQVIETPEGFWLVMAASRREQVERTYEQMKGSVLRQVKNQEMKELYDAYMVQLIAAAKIRKDGAALRLLEVPGGRPTAIPGGLSAPVEEEEAPEGAPGEQ